VKQTNKQREKIAILLTSKPNFNEFALKYFILSMNNIQSTYEFVFPEIDEYFYTEKKYKRDSLFDSFTKVKIEIDFEGEPDYFINIIQSKIEGNWFFACNGNVAFITTDMWERLFSPPSLFEYLLHSISAALIFMHPKLDLDSHSETRGCTLDYTRDKKDDRVDISLGYLCDDCKQAIVEGAGLDYLNDISIMVGRKWIGDINDFSSVAYNLKHFFKFNINKQSGFNKTFLERAKEHFPEIPKGIVIALFSGLIGVLITLLVLGLANKN